MEFELKVALSFLVGGAYVSGVIWLSEKLGSRVGGAVAGLPSTILVGLIFIALAEGSTNARDAVTVVPIMFVASLIYGSAFVRFARSRTNGLKASLIATAAWLIVALLIKQFSNLSFFIIVLIALSGLALFQYLFRNFTTTLPSKIILPRQIYIVRFVGSGLVIAAAVVAARVAGPIWGGIVSSFPALLGSVVYFLNKSQGREFLRGFLRRLPPSYISSLMFLIIVHQTLTVWHPVLSFTVALSTALLYTMVLIFGKVATSRI